ncbi:MAG: tRNA lysidine(34) synthetase TilS [Anaerolineae bacterium]|nr:tRNA lysidine(34) synthetase TilS [Anaerolineae bacterium]
MGDLLARVRTFSDRHTLLPSGARIVVGVSGGADSLVLLHVLVQLRHEYDLMLHVATLDHGLRGDAGAADADFVRQTAETWDIPVTVERADVRAYAAAHGLGIEAAARAVRYAFLARVARTVGAELIAVGHTRDDQAETVLLHLLRGSGLAGLRGMLPCLPLSSHTDDDASSRDAPLMLIRPLLDVSRAEIEAYAAAHDLQPREDATNQDAVYLRNRVRHAVLPLLETINPAVRAALARLAEVLRVDHDLLAQVGAAALTRVLRAARDEAVILDRAAWDDLHLAEKRYVLRAVIARLRGAVEDVTFAHITNAIRVADEGQVGARASLPGDLTLRVDYDRLVLARIGAYPAEMRIDAPALDRDAELLRCTALPVTHTVGDWVLEAHLLHTDDDLSAWHTDSLAAALTIPAGAQLYLRRRTAGDRFQPRGMDGRSQKLSDTFVNMSVPAGWRGRVPLLTVDDMIAWFVAPTSAGLRGRVAEPFAVREESPAGGTVIVGVRWRRA